MNFRLRAALNFELLSSLVVPAALLLAATGVIAQESSNRGAYKSLDLPQQSLGKSLVILSDTYEIDIFADASLIREKAANAVKGDYILEYALRVLLAGSGMQASPTAAGGFALKEADASPTISIGQSRNDSSKTEEQIAIAEVVVTARKTNERLLDIPFSVSVIGSSTLDKLRLRSGDQLLRNTTGVALRTFGGARAPQPKIRGIGSIDTLSPDDTSVSFYLNSVPRTPNNATLQLLDVSRVEILKGPQGTVFGRNSQAGAVNIIPNTPTENFEYGFRVEQGEENQTLYEAYASGSLIKDKLLWRFAGRNTGPEFRVRDANNGGFLPEGNYTGIRGMLEWRATDRLNAMLTLEADWDYNRAAFPGLRPYDGDAEVFVVGPEPDSDVESQRLDLTVVYESDGFDFTSQTGVATTESESNIFLYEGITYNAWLGLPIDFFSSLDVNFVEGWEENAFSQEFRLNSQAGSGLFWVFGGNYYSSTYDYDALGNDDFNVGGPTDGQFSLDFGTDSASIFGETTIPLGERFKITGVLRYTYEEKSFDGAFVLDPAAPPRSFASTGSDDGDLDFSFATGRAAITYALTENANGYLTYARSYKTGGFPDGQTDIAIGGGAITYERSIGNTYEAGLKANLFGGDLSGTIATFYNDIEDDQVLVFDPTVFLTRAENFDTRSYGIEMEGTWQVTANLEFSLGATLLEAEITGIPADSQSGAEIGNPVPDAAEIDFLAAISYGRDVRLFGTDLRMRFDISNRYVGDRESDPRSSFTYPSYHELDINVGFGVGAIEVYLYGENLLDERYDQVGFAFDPAFPGGQGVTFGLPARGRIVGIGFSGFF